MNCPQVQKTRPPSITNLEWRDILDGREDPNHHALGENAHTKRVVVMYAITIVAAEIAAGH